jgi:hypothetical protein
MVPVGSQERLRKTTGNNLDVFATPSPALQRLLHGEAAPTKCHGSMVLSRAGPGLFHQRGLPTWDVLCEEKTHQMAIVIIRRHISPNWQSSGLFSLDEVKFAS